MQPPLTRWSECPSRTPASKSTVLSSCHTVQSWFQLRSCKCMYLAVTLLSHILSGQKRSGPNFIISMGRSHPLLCMTGITHGISVSITLNTKQTRTRLACANSVGPPIPDLRESAHFEDNPETREHYCVKPTRSTAGFIR